MISCTYISFLYISKAFWEKKQKNRLKEENKAADVNEGKFVLNIDVLFAL
jgi:hypothetical protein